MAETKVVRIHQTLYARIPAEEARRLNLREGQTVEVKVTPTGATVAEALEDLRGKYKRRLARLSDEELWGT